MRQATGSIRWALVGRTPLAGIPGEGGDGSLAQNALVLWRDGHLIVDVIGPTVERSGYFDALREAALVQDQLRLPSSRPLPG